MKNRINHSTCSTTSKYSITWTVFEQISPKIQKSPVTRWIQHKCGSSDKFTSLTQTFVSAPPFYILKGTTSKTKSLAFLEGTFHICNITLEDTLLEVMQSFHIYTVHILMDMLKFSLLGSDASSEWLIMCFTNEFNFLHFFIWGLDRYLLFITWN